MKKPNHFRDLAISFIIGFAVASIAMTVVLALMAGAMHASQCSIH